MQLSLKKFSEPDISFKVKWVNDPDNNKFLHYDLPLEESKTFKWFEDTKDKSDRSDYTILCNNQPVGLIGLVDIDYKNRKAEYYILIGDKDYKRRGVAAVASEILFTKYLSEKDLNKIYLYTEIENKEAQRLFERIGFTQEGVLKEDIIQEGHKVDRILYRLLAEEFNNRRGS